MDFQFEPTTNTRQALEDTINVSAELHRKTRQLYFPAAVLAKMGQRLAIKFYLDLEKHGLKITDASVTNDNARVYQLGGQTILIKAPAELKAGHYRLRETTDHSWVFVHADHPTPLDYRFEPILKPLGGRGSLVTLASFSRSDGQTEHRLTFSVQLVNELGNPRAVAIDKDKQGAALLIRRPRAGQKIYKLSVRRVAGAAPLADMPLGRYFLHEITEEGAIMVFDPNYISRRKTNNE